MVKVRCSTIIDAPVDAVWRVLRDFNGHDAWHPAIAESHIEDGKSADQVGCVRAFRLEDGAALREQLLRLSDDVRSFTYCILDSPIPLLGYVATVSLAPVTDGDRTFWEWRSSFSTPPGEEATLAALVAEEIYEAGFDAIKRQFGQAAGRAPLRIAASGPAATSAATSSVSCRAMVLHEFGGPEAMHWDPIDVLPPGPGEVRLRHTAIGLNYIDVYCRTGYFPLAEPPSPLGMEAAGVVTDVGEGVVGFAARDRVAYACPPVGAYSEIRTMKADLLSPLPDDVDDETAAGGLLKGMTAEFLLHRVHRVREGDTVLVHAAAGGVGLLLCQWAAYLGAVVIGTVGSEAKAGLARRNGCAYPIVYTQEDFVARVMEITKGRGADVVYDAVGQATFLKSFEALAIRGHLVSYGQASGPIEPVDIGEFAIKSATVSRPNFAQYTSTPAEVQSITERLFDAMRKGAVRVQVNQRYPLKDAADAHRDLEARRTTGATVLLP